MARRFGHKGSLDFIPAVAPALVPSALLSFEAVVEGSLDGTAAVRLILVLSGSTAALAAGAYRRVAALVYPSLVSLGLLGSAQLLSIQEYLTNWVSALAAGAVLLVVGARLEYLRAVSRRTTQFFRSLQ